MIPARCRVFTPKPLADALVEAVGLRTPMKWLEPSAGEGVFVAAISGRGYSPDSIVALELSRRKLPDVDHLAAWRVGTEALAWMRYTVERFEAVVGNPPYASASSLSVRMRKSFQRTVDPITGRHLKLGSNLWVAFLLQSLALLKQGGSLGFILPASWDYAAYASSMRDWLPRQFETFAVFRSDRPLFDGVSEGCVVIVGHGFRLPHRFSARFECDGIESTCAALRRFGIEWPESEPQSANIKATTGRTLRDFLKVSLGGVTGDSQYFILRESQRVSHSLPRSAFVPVVTKARHLKWPFIGRKQWTTLLQNDEPIWLFRPRGRDLENAMVLRYLRRPISKGGCDRARYKISSRKPWHATPLPSQIDGFLAGSGGSLRIVFGAMPRLNATNTIYVVSFREHLSLVQRYGLARYLLSAEGTEAIRALQRHYAGGLKKFEPGDILGMPVPHTLPECGAEDYIAAFAADRE